MRILQVGKFYPPVKGGIETVVRTVSEGLVSREHSVKVICSNTDAKRISEEKKGVNVLRLPTFSSLASQPLTPSFWAELRRNQKKFDLYHFHSPNPLVESIALTLDKKLPMVVTYHADIVRQKKLEMFYRPILKKFLDRVDKIFVTSEEAIKFSPVLPKFEKKCEVVPIGISESPFEKNEEVEAAAKSARDKYGRYVLFTGRLVSYKGADILIKAMQDIDLSLVMIGTGPLHEELVQLCQDLGIQDRVHFLGHVADSSEFVGLYHGCETFILPSVTTAEAFGIVMVEAMICAKPVVSTKLKSGVRSVNKHEYSGIQVEPGNVEELSNAIKKITSSTELTSKYGQQARLHFENNFTVDKMIDAHERVYADVLKTTEASARS